MLNESTIRERYLEYELLAMNVMIMRMIRGMGLASIEDANFVHGRTEKDINTTCRGGIASFDY